jgi:hypothetical protein
MTTIISKTELILFLNKNKTNHRQIHKTMEDKVLAHKLPELSRATVKTQVKTRQATCSLERLELELTLTSS